MKNRRATSGQAGSRRDASKLRHIIPIAAILTAGAALFPGAGEGAVHRPDSPAQGEDANVETYTCPMHPSVRNPGPGNCPICGMTLTPAGGGASDGTDGSKAVFRVSAAKQQAIGVRIGTASVRELTRSIRAVGSVAPDERKIAAVNLRFSGWIDSVFADYTGKFVTRGAPLFSIYSPEAVAAQKEHLLSRAYASDTAWTVDGLLGGSGLKTATRDRLAFLGLTDAQVDAIEESGTASRTVVITAPVSGHVVGKSATAGMFVEPGTTLYTIADLSTVWLNAEIYQSEIPDVSTGQEAVATFGQIPGREFRGRVTFIWPVLDNTTRSVRARIEVPNGGGALKPGMFGNVVITAGGRKRLSVPAGAVMNTGAREIVFVSAGDDLIEARIVTTGYRNDDWCEVLTGLHEGERVISSANFLIDAESRIQGVLDRLGPADHSRHGGRK
jgi:multidrug efflux pump subunit AcrA (membrane-fusion protein)